jgi:hypothetical protein
LLPPTRAICTHSISKSPRKNGLRTWNWRSRVRSVLLLRNDASFLDHISCLHLHLIFI